MVRVLKTSVAFGLKVPGQPSMTITRKTRIMIEEQSLQELLIKTKLNNFIRNNL